MVEAPPDTKALDEFLLGEPMHDARRSNILGLPALAAVALNFYLVLAPLWALWLGFLILREQDLERSALDLERTVLLCRHTA